MRRRKLAVVKVAAASSCGIQRPATRLSEFAEQEPSPSGRWATGIFMFPARWGARFRSWKLRLVRLRVHTNSGVKVPIGQSTGCP
jgi:hypothetical protein